MLVRRCCLTRPDDLVGLRGVEHVEFPRDINRLKRGYAVRSIDAIAHSDQLPLRQAHAPNATGPIKPDGHHRPPNPGRSRSQPETSFLIYPMAGSGLTLAAPPGLPAPPFLVMSGHRVTIETAGTLTGAAAHPALCLCGWQVHRRSHGGVAVADDSRTASTDPPAGAVFSPVRTTPSAS